MVAFLVSEDAGYITGGFLLMEEFHPQACIRNDFQFLNEDKCPYSANLVTQPKD